MKCAVECGTDQHEGEEKMKRCTKWVSFTLALLMVVSLIPFGTLTALAANVPTPPAGYTKSGNFISNEYLKFQVNNGNFALHTSAGQKLLYGDLSGGTSYSLISVGGSVAMFAPTASYVSADNTGIYSYMVYNGVLIERYCTFSLNTFTGNYDTLEIRIVMTNQSESAKAVGTRFSFDTQIGSNDSAPFRAVMSGSAEQMTITSEREFTGNSIPKFWYAYQSLNDASSLVGSGTFYNDENGKPDMVQFIRYNRMNSGDFYNTIGNSSFGDSAVNIYFDPKTLAPNESRTVSTYYGRSAFSGQVTPTNKLSVYAMAPVMLTANGKNTEYLSNPFEFVATIKNTGNRALSNVTAEIILPDGLEVVEGQSRIYEIGNMASGTDTNRIWNLVAKKQESEKNAKL